MHWASRGDYHGLRLTRIQFHPQRSQPYLVTHTQGVRWIRTGILILPELLERVSAGKILEAASNLSICFNFKVFSFVMTYNNKKDGAIFGCHITFCVIAQNL